MRVQLDPKEGQQHPKIEFRKRASIKDLRSYTDKFVDKFFAQSHEKKAQSRKDWGELDELEQKKAVGQVKLDIAELDVVAHNLIHKLLVLGEEDPQIMHSVHLIDGRMKHQELIQSVKEKIKPGLVSVYLRPFEKQMIKDYLSAVRSDKRLGGTGQEAMPRNDPVEVGIDQEM